MEGAKGRRSAKLTVWHSGSAVSPLTYKGTDTPTINEQRVPGCIPTREHGNGQKSGTEVV
jgi:hypothetical protein